MDSVKCLCILSMLWVGTSSDDSSTCSSASGVNSCSGTNHSSKLAPVLRNAVSEIHLRQIEALISDVETRGRPHLVNQHRDFGEKKLYTAGHQATYLHEHASREVLLLLRNFTQLLGDSNTAWDVSSYAGNLTLRCMEAISYRVEENDMPQQETKLNQLHWHHDGSTWITIAIGLTSSGVDYRGGDFEVRSAGRSQTVRQLRRGDLLAWRGWHEHRVHPVISGHRQVLVAEFWSGQQCSKKVKRAEDSKRTVLKALEQDSSSPILNSILANFYEGESNWTAARQCLHAAIRGDPKHPTAYFNLGRLAVESDDDSRAERYFNEALRLHPGHIKARAQLALLHKRQGNLAAAESNYISIFDSQDQSNEETFAKLGDLLQAEGDGEAALRSYMMAVGRDPKSADKHAKLGKFFQTGRQLTHARNSYETALKLDATNVQALLGIADIGSLKEAKEMLQKASKLRPREVPIHANLGNSYLRMGEHRQATSSFKKTIKLKPNSMELYLYQSKAYFKMNDLKAAQQSLYEALRLQPQSGAVHSDLGFVEMKLGNWKEAEKHWLASVELNPQDPHAHTRLGSALGYKGDFGGATASFKTALQMSPADKIAQGGLMAVDRLLVGSTGIWDKLWKDASI